MRSFLFPGENFFVVPGGPFRIRTVTMILVLIWHTLSFRLLPAHPLSRKCDEVEEDVCRAVCAAREAKMYKGCAE